MREDTREGEQDPARAQEAPAGRPERDPAPAGVASAAAWVLGLQRTAGNRLVAGLLQRQEPAAPPAPAPAPAGQPAGDAVQTEVENHLKTFAAASDYNAQNAAAMAAVKAIISAYGISTKGMRSMKFKPNLDPTANAYAVPCEDNPRETDLLFDQKAFNRGFAALVHTVAHELEHVRQNLMGRDASATTGALGEFRAHVASILQVQVVAGPAGRGFLGGQMRPAGPPAPTLPPLPPVELSRVADQVMRYYGEMASADKKDLKNREEMGYAREKLFERLKAEAPPMLRPPPKYGPKWTPWYEGPPAPTDDILTPEYQEWQDAIRSPWNLVKASWKRLDQAFRG